MFSYGGIAVFYCDLYWCKYKVDERHNKAQKITTNLLSYLPSPSMTRRYDVCEESIKELYLQILFCLIRAGTCKSPQIPLSFVFILWNVLRRVTHQKTHKQKDCYVHYVDARDVRGFGMKISLFNYVREMESSDRGLYWYCDELETRSYNMKTLRWKTKRNVRKPWKSRLKIYILCNYQTIKIKSNIGKY